MATQTEIPHEGIIYNVIKYSKGYQKLPFTASLVKKNGIWYWQETIGGKLLAYNNKDIAIERPNTEGV